MQPTKIIGINTLHSINKIVHFVKNNPRSSMASETSSQVTLTTGPWNDQLLLEEFRKAMLTEHNKQRQDHGSGELILTDDLNTYAQEWAEILAAMEVAMHRPNPTFGENIHKFRKIWVDTTIEGLAKMMCDDFYNEIVLYDFDLAKFVHAAAHFTQLVWYDTTEMGVGMAIDGTQFAYCVVNYAPRGNMKGGFKSNVLPLGTIYEPRPKLDKFIPPSVTTGPKGHCINRFRKLIINQHNIYRKLHSVKFLKGADYLHEIAQKWAEHLAENNVIEYSNKDYGECIYTLQSPSGNVYPDPIALCKLLKEGVENYAYDGPEHTLPHFTQMVWKNSKEIGIGIKQADDGTVYVVCNYNPAGNIGGQYASNVIRPQPKKFKPIKVIV